MQCFSLKTLTKYTAWLIVAGGSIILKCVLNKLVANRRNGQLTQNRITWRTSVKYWRMFGFHHSRKFHTCLNDFHCPKEFIRTSEWTAVCIACVTYLCWRNLLFVHMVYLWVFVCYQTSLICLYGISWFVFVIDEEYFFESCELNVWNINQSNEMTLSANPESNILYLVSPVKMQALVKQYSLEDIVLSYYSVRKNIVCPLPSVKM
jgi:hypothetical protein